MNHLPMEKSISIHLVGVGLFFTYQFLQFNYSKPIEIPEAIHVDLVGLPDEIKNQKEVTDFTSPLEEKPSELAPPAKPQEEKEVVEVPKQTKPEKPDIESALEKIKKFKEEASKKTAKKEEPPTPPQRKQLKSLQSRELLEQAAQQGTRRPVYGNVVSQGNSTTGEISDNPLQAWAKTVSSTIRKSWELPDHLLTQGLKAKAVVHVGSDGRITNFYITQSSGNEEFDAQVKLSIQQTPYVPPPSPNEAAAALRDGVLLNFPLR